MEVIQQQRSANGGVRSSDYVRKASADSAYSFEDQDQSSPMSSQFSDTAMEVISEDEMVSIPPATKQVSETNPWGPIFQSRDHFVDMHVC